MTKTYLHMALHNHFIEIVALTATEFNWIINSTTSIEYQPLYPDHSQKTGVELKKKAEVFGGKWVSLSRTKVSSAILESKGRSLKRSQEMCISPAFTVHHWKWLLGHWSCLNWQFVKLNCDIPKKKGKKGKKERKKSGKISNQKENTIWTLLLYNKWKIVLVAKLSRGNYTWLWMWTVRKYGTACFALPCSFRKQTPNPYSD